MADYERDPEDRISAKKIVPESRQTRLEEEKTESRI